MTGIDAPPEHGSPRAARVLDTARDLLLRRGAKAVTMTEVATRAGVGKGTPYLYWATKADLVVELLVRDLVEVLDDHVRDLAADPHAVRPERFCVHALHLLLDRPLLRAVHTRDEEVLGPLLHDDRVGALHEAIGPRVLVSALLPVWRAHALCRADQDLDTQAFGLRALLDGVACALVRDEHVDTAAAEAVRALLGCPEPDPDRVRTAAAEGARHTGEVRAAALALLAG